MKTNLHFCLFFLLLSALLTGQNETTKWYFGAYAGIDFMSGAPLSAQSPTMLAPENASSIADANGNLLFYTNSASIWDASHNIMANGSGLLGDWSTAQSIIVKQPGSNTIYYLFTIDDVGGPNGLCYHTVDMSLAAGMGSVTVKNASLSLSCAEQITATRHCNGVDVWVMAHSFSGNTFKAFLVTSAGVNPVPVLSAVGSSYSQGVTMGICMKFSPNGRKLGNPLSLVSGQSISSAIELLDFDNSTGQLSSPQTIPVPNTTTLTNNGTYGSEFSPDGSKFYITQMISAALIQCDLCNNNALTVIPSQFSGFSNYLAAMQLGPDGKIYVARASNTSMGVINNPNAAGAACNYNDMGPLFSLYGQMQPTNQLGLPAFETSSLKKLPAFTYTANCQNASFDAPAQLCAAAGASFTSLAWNFGDPATGAANQSTLTSPVHAYSASGAYIAKLILYFPCSTDTVKVPITITNSAPSVVVSGPLNICKGQAFNYSVNGTGTYSWSTGATGTTVVLSPTFSTIYTVTGTDPISGCSNSKTFTVAVSPCTGIEQLNAAEHNGLHMYPNPGQTKITMEVAGALHLKAYNQLGALVMEQELTAGKNTVDVSGLPVGIYFFQALDGKSRSVTRFIKME